MCACLRLIQGHSALLKHGGREHKHSLINAARVGNRPQEPPTATHTLPSHALCSLQRDVSPSISQSIFVGICLVSLFNLHQQFDTVMELLSKNRQRVFPEKEDEVAHISGEIAVVYLHTI